MSVHRGFSLLEVIIALAVLAGSAAVLSQMIDLGQRHASRGIETAEAEVTCESVLNELLAGIRPWEAVRREPVDLFSPFDFSIQIEPIEKSGLDRVVVEVFRMQGAQAASLMSPPVAAGSADSKLLDSDRPPAYRLVRWVFRPANPSVEESREGTALPMPTLNEPTSSPSSGSR